MEPGTEQWERVKSLFDAALRRPPVERERFLVERCPDKEIRLEVLSLLRNDESARDFLLSNPEQDFSATAFRTAVRTFSINTRLGPYEITDFLGAGGMGEVYSAIDTRLNRKVAIKVLPQQFANDRERLRRFEQEAHAVAALNHPNILALYDIGVQAGTPYVVSELLEGGTLRQQLANGPLSVRKAIDYGAQIAKGLSAAHAQGIVHRDLKPENIFITNDGRGKILDFGLAKSLSPTGGTETLTSSEITSAGMIVGTAGYMSPEQVRGETVNHLTDIFSFGAVLYEMLSGRRAFKRESNVETMNAILKEDPPDISVLEPKIPSSLARIVQRSLEKNSEERFYSARDLAFSLEAVSGGSSSAGAIAGERRRRTMWKPLLVAVIPIALAAIFILPARQRRLPRVLRYTQLTHDGLKKSWTAASLLTDGSRIYFGEQDSQHRSVIAQISVTGGPVSAITMLPEGPSVWPFDYSPVRSELLIGREYQTPLWALTVPGGSAPRRVGNFLAEGGTWSPDGQSIVYGNTNELDIAKADGSEPRKYATVQGVPGDARWSPDGKVMRFDVYDKARLSIWEMAADGSNLHPLFPEQEEARIRMGSWTPDGRYFLYNSSRPDGRSSIFATSEKRDFLQGKTEPIELTPVPMSFFTFVPSLDGKKIFTVASLDQGELMRYDAKIRTWIPYLSGISAADVDFSRDGVWVTYVLIPEGTLWRSRLDGSERMQLTVPPLRVAMPRWSPDGKEIVFVGESPGKVETIYLISTEGGKPEQLFFDNKLYNDPNWSPDGSRIVFGESNWSAKAVHILDLQSRHVSELPESQQLYSPRWSPDGRFILACTASTLPPPQKVMTFDLSGKKWQKCCEAPGGFGYPVFSRDGKYLYYSDSDTQVFYRIRLIDNTIETVAKIDVPGGMKMDRDWYWTAITPDGSPLFLRDASPQEIYALDVDLP